MASQPVIDRVRLPAQIALAANRIAPHIRETPLEYSDVLSEECGAEVWCKLENQQLTGSFKVRGAFNKLLTLSADERTRGCIAASSGNHGAAIAHAMRSLGIDGIVYVPEQTTDVKVDAIRRAGAEVRFFGTDGLDTEQHAREFAATEGMTYLSPYNDAAVVEGQGSCGVELARQLPSMDAVYIAVGGGGLIAGVAAFLKAAQPGVRIVSCQPQASAVMTESVKAGKILDLPSAPTLSDGTAGGIEVDSLTFPLCEDLVDGFVTVDEDQIADAMRLFIDAHHQLIEGAAGVAVAGLRADAERVAGKKAIVIVCGGNVSRDTLRRII